MDIDKMNIALMHGLENKNIQSYNDYGWDKIAQVSNTHYPGTRTETFNMIIDDMYNNSISDTPKCIIVKNNYIVDEDVEIIYIGE